jgi:hypothetical protein
MFRTKLSYDFWRCPCDVVAVESHDDFEEAARTLTSIKDGCCRFVPCLVRPNWSGPLSSVALWWYNIKELLARSLRKENCWECTCPLSVEMYLSTFGRLLPGRWQPSIDQCCASTIWFIVVERVLGGSNYKLQRLAEANTVQALVSMLWLNFLVWNNHAIDWHPELDEM